jgi:adenine-specific DNA-methyltransferase
MERYLAEKAELLNGTSGNGKQKLELTWIGKENRPRLEPRILLEDPALSHHAAQRVSPNDIFDNRLIFGDNLLALKALEQEFTGKVKCIYIDPPYNTGEALEHYDDGVEHSIWLSLMRDRLVILYRLLDPNGFLWIHLDDSEVHYCKVLLDEIFSRPNFVAQITYERSGAAGLGLGGFVVNTGESILVYRKGALPSRRTHSSQILEPKTMKRYNNVLRDAGQRVLVREFFAKSTGLPVRVYEHQRFTIDKISLAKFEEREEEIRQEFARDYEMLFRTNQIQKENAFQRELVGNMSKSSLYTVDYTPSRGKSEGEDTTLYYYNAELFAWLKDTSSLEDGHIVKRTSVTNVWSHAEIPKADIANEGGIDFPRSKKPETLLYRILDMCTEPGDLVLDSFAGSGTTGAAAHKMGRRWIMVELGNHCNDLILPRLRSVVDGVDARGISKMTSWKGGGGFRYFKLALPR